MISCYNLDWLTSNFDTGETLNFLFFWGNTDRKNGVHKACFSQWYDSPFTVDRITYATAEHWMMAQKALLFGDNENYEKIIATSSPGEAKAIGRMIQGFDELIWIEKRFDIVRTGNIHKFNQNTDLTSFLLSTKGKVIVEASPVDTIWGIGLAQDSPNIDNIYTWRGLNLLGFALMEVRDFLNDFGHFSSPENKMLPPWKKFPRKEVMDMFWRMGDGEAYLSDFYKFLENLNEREKTIYRLTYPEPLGWSVY